jgi:hypothetical protein
VTKQDFQQMVDFGFAQQRNVFILRLERDIREDLGVGCDHGRMIVVVRSDGADELFGDRSTTSDE